MVAVPETNDLRTSPGTHGAVADPRAAIRMALTRRPKLLHSPRETLGSNHCHPRRSVRTTKGTAMVSPECPRMVSLNSFSCAAPYDYCWRKKGEHETDGPDERAS